jgi:hypothetical protein
LFQAVQQVQQSPTEVSQPQIRKIPETRQGSGITVLDLYFPPPLTLVAELDCIILPRLHKFLWIQFELLSRFCGEIFNYFLKTQ